MEMFPLIKLDKNKYGQIWSLDLVIASIIFLIGIIILYIYVVNYAPQSENQLNELFYEGDLASQLILSDEEQGILSSGKINQTKMNNFYNLNYSQQKDSLGIRNNFYFTIDELKINGTLTNYVGVINNSYIETLIQVTRLTIYNNKPVKFQIFIWR